jgi:AraC-like DNA-binding protein
MAWDQRAGVPDRLIEQLHAIAFLTVLRQACPTAGNPLMVEIMNDEGGEGKAYEDAFGCPVLFGKPALRLVFPVEALRAPVDIYDVSINTTWQACQRTLREAQPDATRFVRAVQEAILHYLPAGAPADLAAATLNLSRRTLQRRLADAGCTYRQLLNGIRERHAACLLADKQLNLQEIAFLLGYSEQSAFNHAYHRWTGISPSEARN